jgi:hypothetical protein
MVNKEQELKEEIEALKLDILNNHNNLFPEPYKWKLDSFELRQTCENYIEYAKLQAKLEGLREGKQSVEDIKQNQLADHFQAGRKEALQKEIEYILWLLEHKGKGYTIEFYESNLEERLNKLRCKLLLLPEEKKE